MVLAEIAVARDCDDELESFLKSTSIVVSPLTTHAAFLASRALMQDRVAKRTKTGVVQDFFIGAHAEAEGWTCTTLDAMRCHSYFSEGFRDLPLSRSAAPQSARASGRPLPVRTAA